MCKQSDRILTQMKGRRVSMNNIGSRDMRETKPLTKEELEYLKEVIERGKEIDEYAKRVRQESWNNPHDRSYSNGLKVSRR